MEADQFVKSEPNSAFVNVPYGFLLFYLWSWETFSTLALQSFRFGGHIPMNRLALEIRLYGRHITYACHLGMKMIASFQS